MNRQNPACLPGFRCKGVDKEETSHWWRGWSFLHCKTGVSRAQDNQWETTMALIHPRTRGWVGNTWKSWPSPIHLWHHHKAQRKGRGGEQRKGRKGAICGEKNKKKDRKQTPAVSISQSWGANWLLPGQQPLASNPAAVTSLDSSATQNCQRVSRPLLNVMSLFENQGWVWVSRSCPLEIVIFRVGTISLCQAPFAANYVHAEV